MYVLYACMFVYRVNTLCPQKPEKAPDVLYLVLWMTMNNHKDARNQSQDLWMSG